ncbi:melanoma-associated antigen B5-like [Panthera uncia]|uniref:melanoma-associated antigen B5-like n=1 Tax=Panthera uncia TaxID=29064 RepID=UPI0020FF8983|nr:melanoma-associated antigen B5-like [Panthera uncia]
MPRRHKSKFKARERRRQARGEAQGCEDAQAKAAAEAEPTPSSAAQCEDTTQSVPTTGSSGASQRRRRRAKTAAATSAAATSAAATSAAATSAALSGTKSDEESNNQDEERVSPYEAPFYGERPGEDSLSRKPGLLEQYLLYKYKMKQPILKQDMLKIIGPNYEDRFPEILKKAAERIEIVFAVDLQEIDSTRYDLVSKLKLPNNGRVRAGRGLPKTGLLMNILGMIFMKGNCAAEEDIWKFLGLMRVYPGRKHFIYGEPRKLITKDLVRLQYLEYRQVANSDPPRHEFLWGPNALAETTKMKVLQFLSKVNDTIPTAFPSYYEEALREEEERAQARGATGAGTTARVIVPSSVMARSIFPPLLRPEASNPLDKIIQRRSKN